MTHDIDRNHVTIPRTCSHTLSFTSHERRPVWALEMQSGTTTGTSKEIALKTLKNCCHISHMLISQTCLQLHKHTNAHAITHAHVPTNSLTHAHTHEWAQKRDTDPHMREHLQTIMKCNAHAQESNTITRPCTNCLSLPLPYLRKIWRKDVLLIAKAVAAKMTQL